MSSFDSNKDLSFYKKELAPATTEEDIRNSSSRNPESISHVQYTERRGKFEGEKNKQDSSSTEFLSSSATKDKRSHRGDDETNSEENVGTEKHNAPSGSKREDVSNQQSNSEDTDIRSRKEKRSDIVGQAPADKLGLTHGSDDDRNVATAGMSFKLFDDNRETAKEAFQKGNIMTTGGSTSQRETRNAGFSRQSSGPPRQSSLVINTPDIIFAKITTALNDKLGDKGRFSVPFYIKDVSHSTWNTHPTELTWKFGDPAYVDLPLSSAFRKNRTEDGNSENIPKWLIVEERLVQLKSFCEHIVKSKTLGDAALAKEMKECIRSYNDKMAQDCNFHILNDRELQRQIIFAMPNIVDRCLELGSLLQKPIPILRKGNWHTLYLTRQLCCSLLANAFFCTVPHNSRDPSEFTHFHFLKLFHEGDEGAERSAVKVEKIKCVVEYFQQISAQLTNRKEMDSIISFERRYLNYKPNWTTSDKPLCGLTVDPSGVIEDAKNMLQVDFANKYIGGGILSVGMVQEEIRFAMCPDLIVSRLFTEVLGHDEVLVITGAKQFNDYTGYRTTFKMKRLSPPPSLDRDNHGRDSVELVAMDALNFKKGLEFTQYESRNINRELNKAYNGFYLGRSPPKNSPGVATGNWGCGAFNGDAQLKLLLQWMAASEADRLEVVYYTIGDQKFTDDIGKVAKHLHRAKVTVGKLYKVLVKYENSGSMIKGRAPVFEYVIKNT